MKILLLSAYNAKSHQYWCQSLVENLPEHQWTVLTLEPRFFSWRIRGNSLSWAFNERKILSKKYDLLIATSMVDLNGLRGFIPSLASIPNLLYFHENQFSYPLSYKKERQQHPDNLEAKIVSLYSALCADKILFNSQFNQDSFLAGAKNLLKRLPDQVPKGLIETIFDKSSILPVPIKIAAFDPAQKLPSSTMQIIWNHRWEYDKGPEQLLACIKSLPKELPCKFHIVGQNFRNSPEAFNAIKDILKDSGWLGTWGFVESKSNYHELLIEADVALSTAIHDFQGLAILEAVAAGCVPVVPDRLAYKEIFPSEYRYRSSLNDIQKEAESAAAMLKNLAQHLLANQGVALAKFLRAPDISTLSWESLAEKYRQAILDTKDSFHNKPKN